MALKIALVHINDTTKDIRVLIDHDLYENAKARRLWHGRRRITKFLREQEASIKGRSVEITNIEGEVNG